MIPSVGYRSGSPTFRQVHNHRNSSSAKIRLCVNCMTEVIPAGCSECQRFDGMASAPDG